MGPIGLRLFGLKECLEPCDCLGAIYGQSASGSSTRRFVRGKKRELERDCASDATSEGIELGDLVPTIETRKGMDRILVISFEELFAVGQASPCYRC